jgi:ABC-type antimicrobial peptide transport system permease subunit
MMSGGIFLVIAVNAFRIGAEADPTAKVSGTGGFALIGESTLPIYEDLNSEAGQDVFALDEKIMKQVHVVSFRVREGDDASCLNLNKAQRPMLTALNPEKLSDRFAFVEGAWEKLSDRKNGDGEDSSIPAIADQATAMWGLGKGVGDTIFYTDSQGHEFKVKLVGLLAGSVLQGKVVISEQAFLSKYPDAAGYKFFLIDSPLDKTTAVSAHLTKQLETRGLALESTVDRLAAFSAVQNTYIGIFTILGGLGVLLGTAGLGVLAARNVLERRGEFGLMQALGFRSSALRGMVLSEHVTLLIAGLVLGLLSAAIAVWPNVKQSGGALPVAFLGALTLGILAFGIIICWLSAALALRGKLLDSLRKE